MDDGTPTAALESVKYYNITPFIAKQPDVVTTVLSTFAHGNQKSVRGVTSSISFHPLPGRPKRLFVSPLYEPTASLGLLAALPTEVLTMLALAMDIRSALMFSSASRSTKHLMATIPPIAALREHAMDAILALLRTPFGSRVTVEHLASVQRNGTCQSCGDFGAFFFIPTSSRHCYNCILHNPACLVVTTHGVSKLSGISTSKLNRTLPIFPSLHDRYGSHLQSAYEDRSEKKDNKRIRNIAAGVHVAAVYGDAAVPRANNYIAVGNCGTPASTYLVSTVFMPHVTLRGSTEKGLSCRGCHFVVTVHEDGDHFMALWYDGGPLRLLLNREYSREGLLKHVNSCARAKLLWCDGSREGLGTAVQELMLVTRHFQKHGQLPAEGEDIDSYYWGGMLFVYPFPVRLYELKSLPK